MDLKAAWNAAVSEFNNFGLAVHDPKHQIDKTTSSLMFGFKVRVSNGDGLSSVCLCFGCWK